MKTTRWAATSGAMIMTAALAATAAGSMSGASPDGAGTTPPASADAPRMIDRSADEQTANFAVLRRQTAAEDDPGTGPKGPFGANLRLARRVATGAGVVRVVPANGAMCLRADTRTGAAWACVSTADARTGRLILSLREPGATATEAVFALVPDDARDVSAGTAGAKSNVVVESNVVALADTEADTLSFTDAGGQQRSVLLP